MAQRTFIELIDDLDGSEATETVTFTLDGTTYEIDLNDENAGNLRQAMERFVSAARRVSSSRPRRSDRGRASSSAKGSTTEVREWARANGYVVSDRGRVPAEVQKAYDAAS